MEYYKREIMKEKQIYQEPEERIIYRLKCKNYGMYGICFKRSGYIGGGCHITAGCTGKCRRMTMWDNKHGYAGIEFKIQEEC